MVSWMIRKFVKDYQDTESASVRYAVCRLCGYLGIGLNLFLFVSKYAVGWMVGSVAIKGDAVNNLTDSVSNIVSILSFHFAEKPADKEHPYGHERTEAVTALFMGMVIVYLGVEMLKQSIEKILSPGSVEFEWGAVAVLLISICVKLTMYSYNKKYGRIYDSSLLEANAIDSRNDVAGTVLILLSTLISPIIHYDLDGIMGLIVSGIIFYSAYDLLKDVISSLLGEAPDPDTINKLGDILLEDPVVLDVHDIIFHSYGPKKIYATAHVEVDGSLDLVEVHNRIDTIERHVQSDMQVDLVIHVDPVLLNDPETIEAEDQIDSILESINPEWNMHDFRIHKISDSLVEVYFDLVVPYTEKREEKQLEKLISSHLPETSPYRIILRLEHPYS